MSDSVTMDEQEKILKRAKMLLREPGSWTQGMWKCRLYVDKQTGNAVGISEDQTPDPDLEPATTANGLPVYQYCIEGAVNQAACDVLGDERAHRLGAIGEEEDLEAEDTLTNKLGLNEIAQELYNEVAYEDRAAMSYNDNFGDHSGVLRILDTGLKRVRKALREAA